MEIKGAIRTTVHVTKVDLHREPTFQDPTLHRVTLEYEVSKEVKEGKRLDAEQPEAAPTVKRHFDILISHDGKRIGNLRPGQNYAYSDYYKSVQSSGGVTPAQEREYASELHDALHGKGDVVWKGDRALQQAEAEVLDQLAHKMPVQADAMEAKLHIKHAFTAAKQKLSSMLDGAFAPQIFVVE